MFYSEESVGKQRQTRSLGVCRCEKTELWMISQRNVLTCEGRKEEPNLTLTTDLFIDHSAIPDVASRKITSQKSPSIRTHLKTHISWPFTCSEQEADCILRKYSEGGDETWPSRHRTFLDSITRRLNITLILMYKLKYLHETISSHVLRVHVSRWCYKHWLPCVLVIVYKNP